MDNLLMEIVVGLFANQVHVWIVGSWSSRAPLDGVDLLLVGLQVVHAVVPVHGPHLQGHVVTARGKKLCNASIYSCLCGSLLESMQEGKGEIRYHFRQHGCYACQSLGNLVTIVFFQSC